MTTIMLAGNATATPAMLRCARWCIGCIEWVRDSSGSSPYEILIADGYGVDQEVLRTAKALGIPYRVVGIHRNAKNGERRCYERFLPPVSATTAREKQAARDRYMVVQAEVVICITDSLLPSGAPDLVYVYAKSFSSKLVQWKDVKERPLEQIGDEVTLYNGMTGTVQVPRDEAGYVVVQTEQYPEWRCHYSLLRQPSMLPTGSALAALAN